MIGSKAAVLPVLRARCKCAVVREEISRRGKLLRGLCALTRTAKTSAGPPVQVSAADSWVFPDIDLFFPGAVVLLHGALTDALSNTDAACGPRVYTDARTSWPHTVYSRLDVMLTARFPSELRERISTVDNSMPCVLALIPRNKKKS